MRNRIFGGFGLVLAIFYIWAATTSKDSFMVDVVGPRAFPYIVGAVLGVTSIYFMIRPDKDPAWPILRDLAEIVVAAAVMLVYSWALPEFGFVIFTIFATAYLTWRLGTPPLVSVAVGVATSIGVYVVFHLILGLALAKGPLGF
ncbi:MAG: tripartite tricarboxylate transporter TctB family protein [Sedimentitalea sp.]|uniref:tripartite tricarboxylate transporter TctB family protein n=1 Tax=Sedimentitalea sp. TaxID=2048915 RepID=UPI0032662B09